MFRDLSVIRALEPVLSAIALVGRESLRCPYGSAWPLPAVRQFVSAHISTFLRIAASVSQAYALMRCAPIKRVFGKSLVLHHGWLKAICTACFWQPCRPFGYNFSNIL